MTFGGPKSAIVKPMGTPRLRPSFEVVVVLHIYLGKVSVTGKNSLMRMAKYWNRLWNYREYDIDIMIIYDMNDYNSISYSWNIS